MLGIDLLQVVQTLLAIVIAITVHEFSHAFSAYRLGDPTPKFNGRVTLNPIAHLDPLGSIMLVVSAISGFGFGWGKPVPINPYNIRSVGAKTGMAITSLAGPLSNLVLAAIVCIPLRFDLIQVQGLVQFLLIIASINIFLAIFNLIPLPPLDGFHVAEWFVPQRYSHLLAQIEQYGPLILLAVVFLGMNLIGPLLSRLAFTIMGAFLGVSLF